MTVCMSPVRGERDVAAPCTPPCWAGDERRVALLFLAHDGVANPEIWERWRRSQGPEYAERIVFCVFRNKAIKYPSDFCDRYDMKLRRKTTWCSSSIVKATIESLEWVLTEHPSVAVVYTVSGLDVPIQPPEAMFTTRQVVTEGVAKVIEPFKTVMAYLPENRCEVRDWHGWSDNEDIRRKLVCHVQWCALSRKHAQRIVDYQHADRLLKIGNKLSNEWCPDEWVIGTILALQNVNLKRDTIDWTITDHYRQSKGAPSPITWQDMTKTKLRVFWAPPAVFRSFHLQGVINQVSRQEGNLFFRKVGRLTSEEVDLFFEPPPPVTPKPPRVKTTKATATTPPRLRIMLRGRGRCMCPEGGKGDCGGEGGEGAENRDPNVEGRVSSAGGAMKQQHQEEEEGGRKKEDGHCPSSSITALAIPVAVRASLPEQQYEHRSLRNGKYF